MSLAAKPRMRRTISITAFLVLAFGGLAALGLIGQIVVSVLSARENTAELIRDKAQITIDGIESRVHSILDPVVTQGQAMGVLARSEAGRLDSRIDPFLAGFLVATPQLQSIWLVVPDKTGRKVRRTGNGLQTLDRALAQTLVESSQRYSKSTRLHGTSRDWSTMS